MLETTTVNSVRITYHDTGSGPAVLLVHAFPLSSDMWQAQIDALAADYRVIAPDLRGFGASEYGTEAVSIDHYAADLAALLDSLGIQDVAYCGLSMGGYIAFAFLRRYRERVRALVLADTRAGPDTEEARAKRQTNALRAEEEGTGPLADEQIPAMVAGTTGPGVRNQMRAMFLAASRQGTAGALRAMAARPDSRSLLATIDIPTLIIVGEQDSLTPPDEARAMHTAVANSTLVTIPDAGHLSAMEQPDAFNTALRRFLAEAQ